MLIQNGPHARSHAPEPSLGLRVQKLPVPVHIITGALGVGKTTAIQQLLRSKPPGERWAVLVNEFGALGIDAALIEASGGAGDGGLSVHAWGRMGAQHAASYL